MRLLPLMVVLGAMFAAAAGCGAIAGVDFDEVHLAPEAGTDGGIVINPQSKDGGTGVGPDGGNVSTCTPDPSAVTCAGNCGATKDNCGADRACSSDCGSGKECNTGKCVCKTDPQWCKNRCGQTADNCGATIDCGACTTADPCTNNSCGCTPEPVATSCGTKQCGTAVNNCGQTVNCGNAGACSNGAFCKADGSCCADGANVCAGRCGGVTVKNSCGQDVGCPANCNAGDVCNGTNCCTPEPLSTTCAGVACGPKTNNCGQAVTCPNTCVAPNSCGGGGAGANGCGCTPKVDPCPLAQCKGTASDGCGGQVTCTNQCADACPCAGGTCTASNFCSCKPPPCL